MAMPIIDNTERKRWPVMALSASFEQVDHGSTSQ
jgi:hypothetical protein